MKAIHSKEGEEGARGFVFFFFFLIFWKLQHMFGNDPRKVQHWMIQETARELI